MVPGTVLLTVNFQRARTLSLSLTCIHTAPNSRLGSPVGIQDMLCIYYALVNESIKQSHEYEREVKIVVKVKKKIKAGNYELIFSNIIENLAGVRH